MAGTLARIVVINADFTYAGGVDVAAGPARLAVDNGRHRLYVGPGYTSAITAIDTSTLQITGTVTDVGGISDFAVDPNTGRLYAAMPFVSNVAVIDPVSLSDVADIYLGGGEPVGPIWLDGSTHRVWIPTINCPPGGCLPAGLVVVDTTTTSVVASANYVYTYAELGDPTTHRVFVSSRNGIDVFEG